MIDFDKGEYNLHWNLESIRPRAIGFGPPINRLHCSAAGDRSATGDRRGIDTAAGAGTKQDSSVMYAKDRVP